ncbi:MAG TPA: hypothetical protein VMF87_02295 [Streptosporangiaceae bacterium]|nr:hypothetical protein [Streptosporangiaceae bacterium]
MRAAHRRRGSVKAARTEAIPPQNEVSGGPDTPLELGETGWRNTVRRTGKKFVRDRCAMTAGSLTALIVGVVVALWSASSGMAALETVFGAGPNREAPRWQWVSPGGVAGTLHPGAQAVARRVDAEPEGS